MLTCASNLLAQRMLPDVASWPFKILSRVALIEKGIVFVVMIEGGVEVEGEPCMQSSLAKTMLWEWRTWSGLFKAYPRDNKFLNRYLACPWHEFLNRICSGTLRALFLQKRNLFNSFKRASRMRIRTICNVLLIWTGMNHKGILDIYTFQNRFLR